MMRWQAECMRAFASGRPPLPPPAGVDLEKLAKQQQEQMAGGNDSSMMGRMMGGGAEAIDCTPFTGDEAAFESDVVRGEYEALCRDHDGIIRLGEAYGAFDPRGKLAYLDALEAVEGRWDTFFARFKLLGALNPDFTEQTAKFLDRRAARLASPPRLASPHLTLPYLT